MSHFLGMNEEDSTPPTEHEFPANREPDTLPEVESIPLPLVYSLGGLAMLLLLVGCGVLLLRWWDCLHVGVQVASLMLPLLLMWGGYAFAAKRGWRSAEVLGAFVSMSWLLLLFVWQTFCPANPHWLPGGLFVMGVMAVAVFFPNRTSVVMLGVASAAVMVLLWYQSTAGWSQPAGVLVWAGVVTVLCLWGLGGFLCGESRYAVYAPYAFLGPLMFSVYLLVLQGIILYLPPMSGNSWQIWLWVVAMGIAPLVVFCIVHHLRAVRCGKPALNLSFFALMGAMFMVLPVGMWASQLLPMVPGALVLFVYAVCLVRYGAVYKSTYFMAAGCVLAFLAAAGVSFGHGGSMVGGGITMLLLGMGFAWLAYRMYSRRRQLQAAVILLKKRREVNKFI